jgi:hypothetical protein
VRGGSSSIASRIEKGFVGGDFVGGERGGLFFAVGGAGGFTKEEELSFFSSLNNREGFL